MKCLEEKQALHHILALSINDVKTSKNEHNWC